MNNTISIQAYQELEYVFPYHYVSKMQIDGFTQHFVDSWGINYISTIELMLEYIGNCNIKSLIDIGCGDGRLIREIHKRFPLVKLKGVDYSSCAINLARAMNQDYPSLIYEQVDISSVNISEKYDTAVLMEVFEHIPLEETAVFLSSVHRSLKKGGLLFLTVPHSNKALEYKHFQHFSIKSISDYLYPYFDIVEVIPFEKKGLRRKLLEKVLCNSLFVLNNGRILKYIYELHGKYLFHCSSEQDCQRIFVKAVAK